MQRSGVAPGPSATTRNWNHIMKTSVVVKLNAWIAERDQDETVAIDDFARPPKSVRGARRVFSLPRRLDPRPMTLFVDGEVVDSEGCAATAARIPGLIGWRLHPGNGGNCVLLTPGEGYEERPSDGRLRGPDGRILRTKRGDRIERVSAS